MGFVQNIFSKLNTRKYIKLKHEYINNFRESGYLGSVSDIQEYIAEKKISVMSKSEKYGDEYDVIEEIFSDQPEILERIKKNRGEVLLGESRNLNTRMQYETLDSDETAIDTKTYKEFEKEVLYFDSYYNKDREELLDSNLDETLKRISKLQKVIDELNGNDRTSATEFNIVISSIIKGYGINKIVQLDDISEKQNIFIQIQETLSSISKNENFVKFARSCNIEEIDTFFDRIESVAKLQELGIETSLEDTSISYIDVSDETKTKKIYDKINSRKKEMSEEDFDVSSFAMVRTTPYFPINREMEIVDELSSRTFIPNFLSGALKQKALVERFGENWCDNVFGNQDEESRKAKIAEKEEIEQQYETVSPMYRSTKHFTLNGLVSSHMYGDFSGNPYIFIDPLEEHIDDENLLSINEADTYFKVSREKPFALSKKAKLMMPLEEYLKIKDEPEKLKEISKYDITLFSGDEKTAVDIKLFEMGYMPEDIGMWGYELETVMDRAISNLSKEHGIEVAVHYESDIKAEDQAKTNEMTEESNLLFVDKIFKEFGIDEKFRDGAISQSLTDEELREIINDCGEDKIKSFIATFNSDRRKELDLKREEFYAKKEKDTKVI